MEAHEHRQVRSIFPDENASVIAIEKLQDITFKDKQEKDQKGVPCLSDHLPANKPRRHLKEEEKMMKEQGRKLQQGGEISIVRLSRHLQRWRRRHS